MVLLIEISALSTRLIFLYNTQFTNSSFSLSIAIHLRSGRVDSLDIPFHYVSSERLAYCPSRNRTCGFLAYGSSNRHLIPVPYIGCQMRFRNVVIPHSPILFVPEFSFLVSPIQHLVCAVLKIFPETLYRMKIPVHSIVIAMSSNYPVNSGF